MTQFKEYSIGFDSEQHAICIKLGDCISDILKNSESKLFHGAPVWFIDKNPIVGYSKKKNGIALLFWSGQSFATKGLSPIGKYKAAEIVFSKYEDIDEMELQKLLHESLTIQWDYKNIRINSGELKRIK